MNASDVVTITRQPDRLLWTIESTAFAHGAPIQDCDYALRYEIERDAKRAGAHIVHRDACEPLAA